MNNMPPEMQVRLRLLGYSAYRLADFDRRFGLADVEAWWRWVEMLENNPETLKQSLARYKAMDSREQA